MEKKSFLKDKASTEEKVYWDLHADRLLHTVAEAKQILQKSSETLHIMDVGPHFLTLLLKKDFPTVDIDSLGFWYDSIGLSDIVTKHYEFNIASLSPNSRDLPVEKEKYDLVVMAEVLEHVHISPSLVLPAFRKILKPGGTLLLTTPNAVALSKRVWMLLGRNPFDMLKETLDNPGHFREYTAQELRQLAKEAGFTKVQVHLVNVFQTNPLVRLITNLIPSLRQNLFCTFSI